MRPTRWRVRVRRIVEESIQVMAIDEAEAERLAADVPRVLSVFAKSAMRIDDGRAPETNPGVQEE